LILGASSAALLVLALPAGAAAADDNKTQACVESLWPAAKGAGVTRATFDHAFQGFTNDPEVVEAANFQPEYVKPIGEYMDRVVSDKRIEAGKQKLVDYGVVHCSRPATASTGMSSSPSGGGVELRHPARRQERIAARHAILHRQLRPSSPSPRSSRR
jgi:hypothetical protein